jgi:hypothetical protein
MDRIPEDPEREERIDLEIVVDAYEAEERLMSWYYYLDDTIGHPDEPLLARCVAERVISPLEVGDEVEVLGMAPPDECQGEMFVVIRWGRPGGKEGLGVPLSQLEFLSGDEDVRQAQADWHYWVGRGYQF